jgi:hypothetical protein
LTDLLVRAAITGVGAASSRFVVAAAVVLAWAALDERVAAAQPPDAELLARLGKQAAAFESLFKRATFKMRVVLEELDGDGKVASRKTVTSHVEANGTTRHHIVDTCAKDGEDCKAKEQEHIRKQEAEPDDDDDDLRSPFLPAEQSRYVFDQVAVDTTDPARVKIAFSPKNPDKHTVEGSAWVDTGAGAVVTGAARLVKTPMFVDWVHVSVELGAPTPLGPGPSKMTIEGQGGFLFIMHKHFRAEVVFSDYRLP